jgi:hypothetical protein
MATRKIIFRDDYTEISITKIRGRVIRRYIDTDDEICFIEIDEAMRLADLCEQIDADPNRSPSHSYTREYVKDINARKQEEREYQKYIGARR